MDVEQGDQKTSLIESHNDKVPYVILLSLVLSPLCLIFSSVDSRLGSTSGLPIVRDCWLMFALMIVLICDNWMNSRLIKGGCYHVDKYWFGIKFAVVVSSCIYFCFINSLSSEGRELVINTLHSVVTCIVLLLIIWVQEVLNYRWKQFLSQCPKAIQYKRFDKVTIEEEFIISFLKLNCSDLSAFCTINSRSLTAVICVTIAINANYTQCTQESNGTDILAFYIAHYLMVFACFEGPVRKIASHNAMILELRSALLFDKEANITVKFFNSIEPDRGFIVSFYVSLLFLILKVILM